AALGIVSVAAFCFKQPLFDLLLRPRAAADPTESLPMISTQLTSQFSAHLKTAFLVALLICLPYWLYLGFSFLKPALYPNEKKAVGRVFAATYFLFLTGIAVAYFILFPFTYRFLFAYRVSDSILPYISIDSYLGTFMTLSLLMGLLFELPVLIWLLAYLGIVNKNMLKKYRRHAYVGIVTLAAVVTPTTDVFSLALTALPILVLYEFSLFIAGRTENGRASRHTEK
ncbi:MAG: twin-arginine translocase subunit TatC, partial [Bacteroidales bacterium]|nr:twin-arginine translocase subunit TatC [Bacteroidales bacterium]